MIYRGVELTGDQQCALKYLTDHKVVLPTMVLSRIEQYVIALCFNDSRRSALCYRLCHIALSDNRYVHDGLVSRLMDKIGNLVAGSLVYWIDHDTGSDSDSCTNHCTHFALRDIWIIELLAYTGDVSVIY